MIKSAWLPVWQLHDVARFFELQFLRFGVTEWTGLESQDRQILQGDLPTEHQLEFNDAELDVIIFSTRDRCRIAPSSGEIVVIRVPANRYSPPHEYALAVGMSHCISDSPSDTQSDPIVYAVFASREPGAAFSFVKANQSGDGKREALLRGDLLKQKIRNIPDVGYFDLLTHEIIQIPGMPDTPVNRSQSSRSAISSRCRIRGQFIPWTRRSTAPTFLRSSRPTLQSGRILSTGLRNQSAAFGNAAPTRSDPAATSGHVHPRLLTTAFQASRPSRQREHMALARGRQHRRLHHARRFRARAGAGRLGHGRPAADMNCPDS
jgi:hypothetical protein